MYRIVILASALKDLEILPKKYQDLIRSRIGQLAFDPRPRGCKTLSDQMYRLRQEGYRIIYRVDDQDMVVTIAKVKPRREAYR